MNLEWKREGEWTTVTVHRPMPAPLVALSYACRCRAVGAQRTRAIDGRHVATRGARAAATAASLGLGLRKPNVSDRMRTRISYSTRLLLNKVKRKNELRGREGEIESPPTGFFGFINYISTLHTGDYYTVKTYKYSISSATNLNIVSAIALHALLHATC